MGKAKENKKSSSGQVSPLAQALLNAMAAEPATIEYHTRLLGGAFTDEDLERLDAAYQELAERGWIEDAGVGISFFGARKRLHRISARGAAAVQRGAA